MLLVVVALLDKVLIRLLPTIVIAQALAEVAGMAEVEVRSLIHQLHIANTAEVALDSSILLQVLVIGQAAILASNLTAVLHTLVIPLSRILLVQAMRQDIVEKAMQR